MGKNTKIPAPDPRLYESLEKQTRQGDDMLKFIQGTYADNQVRLDRQEKLNDSVVGQQMRLADSAEARSNDQYEFYQRTGRPMIEKSIKDATEFDSESNLADARGKATALATQQFDNAQGQQNRQLKAIGVNPNSGKFAALNNQMMAQRALGTAGMANAADEGRRMGAIGLRQQAGNLANGMQAQSMQWGGQAGAMGSSASGIGATNLSNAMGVQGQVTGGMNAAANIFGSGASGYNNAYSNTLKGAEIKSQAQGAAMGGFGQLAGTAASMYMGGMADGGKVRGPGTGVSDSVPAVNTDTGQPIRLSNGEYVIPADVVKAKGEEFFAKLLEKHHLPAARQRAGNIRRSA